MAVALFPDYEAPIQLHGQPDKGSKLGIDTAAIDGEVYVPSPARSRQGSVRSLDPKRNDSAPTTPTRERRGYGWDPDYSMTAGAGARTPPAKARQASLFPVNGLDDGGDSSSRQKGSSPTGVKQREVGGGYAPIGNGLPAGLAASPRRRAKSAQVAEPADWHAIGTTNGHGQNMRSASLAVPPPPVLPEKAQPKPRKSSTGLSHLPPPVPSLNTSTTHPPSPARTNGISHSTSVSSALSAATSNSSNHPRAPPGPHTTPHPGSGACFNSATDPDGVAALVQQLYARLDDQGVFGDGWDEGKERSRDGIILRLDPKVDTPTTPRKPHMTPTAVPDDVASAAKADQVLRRVDRYGFFSTSHPAALACQHHRLATLSSAPYSILPSVSSSRRQSSKFPPPPAASTAEPSRTEKPALTHRASTASLLPTTALAPEKIALETKRIDKWAAMLTVAKRDSGGNAQNWTVAPGWWNGRLPGGGGGQGGKYRKLQRRVFKGIPDRWRRAVWGLMMEKMSDEVALQSRTRVPTLAELEAEYHRLVAQPYVQDVQIDLDVPRTISGHVLFHTRYGQGQRALFHVLHAFGLRSEEIGGYCQGMGPIAATLLCYFEPERAYAGLARLFDQYRLSHIFASGFPGLHEAFYVQERLVELLMPAVHVAFKEQMISTSAYGTKWYITLFANSVPFATQLRLWDGLLLEGLDFLIVTAVAIIWHFQHDFTSPDASFESILSRLSSYFFVESDDALLRWIRKTLRLKGLREKMKAWRLEWQGFVRDGTSEGRLS
ncbi:hypothetical protein JCM10908_002039 [Rhodotorula pacifica]|uniref:TBC domain-containing protein n=1 Tax=Rhodotorula pacifica TaxID=1495444 RepID=UPI003179656E